MLSNMPDDNPIKSILGLKTVPHDITDLPKDLQPKATISDDEKYCLENNLPEWFEDENNFNTINLGGTIGSRYNTVDF